MNSRMEIRESAMMTPEEARQSADAIKRGMNNIRVQLLDFYEREGWKALGYGSWLECVKVEFGQSKAYLYRQLEAAQIEQRIEEAEKSPVGDSAEVPSVAEKSVTNEEAFPEVYGRKAFVSREAFKPIRDACSADLLSAGKIRKPFIHNGQSRITTGVAYMGQGGFGDYADTWRVIPEKEYDGDTYSYSEICALFDISRGRGDETGFLVSFLGKKYVLADPLRIMVKREPIPERHLRPLASVPPAEQAGVYKRAKETAPGGKLTAAHVEKTVKEVTDAEVAATYRIRNIRTNEWWEGAAVDAADACSQAGWQFTECEIKVRSHTGSGGWCKCRELDGGTPPPVDCQGCADHRGMINKHHGVKVPGNSGKCIRAGGLCEKALAVVPGRDLNHEEYKRLLNSNPADLVQKIINLIDTITDDNPRCKEALAKIAVHVWNRQHKQIPAPGITYCKEAQPSRSGIGDGT